MAKIIRFPIERARRDVMRERQCIPMPLIWLPLALSSHFWFCWTGALLGCMGAVSGSPGRKGQLAKRGGSFKRRT